MGQSTLWREIAGDLIGKYIATWNALDPAERERAARALVDHLAPTLLDFIAAELHDAYKDKMVHELLAQHLTPALIRQVITFVGESLTADGQRVGYDKRALVDLIKVFARVWDQQQFPRKKSAMDEIADLIERIVLAKLVERLWDAYTAKKMSGGRDLYAVFRVERYEPLLHELLPATTVDRLSVDFIKDKLLGLEEEIDGRRVRGKQAFSHMLKRNTKSKLDMIQLNGTVLGAALGLLVGVISYITM